MHHFKTVNRIKSASLEDLEEAVNKKLARVVWDYFQKQNPEI
jgi:excinuclease UvrABC nuclease subunit